MNIKLIKSLFDLLVFDEERGSNCQELEAIEISCKPAKSLIPGLFAPCVMHQVCRSCVSKNITKTFYHKLCINYSQKNKLIS